MTENLSTSSKPPLSDFPNHHKLSPKYPMETITLSEETSEIFHTDVNEFPSKSPQCRHAIVIPYFSCNDGISVKDDLTKSAKYLTMKSLGRKIEDLVIEKMKRQQEDHHSETGIEESRPIQEEKYESDIVETYAKRPSRVLGAEQLKILEEQIKEKEMLRKDVKEIKKKRARKSLFMFHSESAFRKKQINIAESKYFSYLIVAVTIVNTIAICLANFSQRLQSEDHTIDMYNISPTSYFIELGCNIFFLFVFVVRTVAFGFVFGNRTYLRSGWNILSFIVLCATLLLYLPNEECVVVGAIIRCLRPIAILKEIQPIKKNANAFVRTLFTIYDKLIPIIFVLLFAAIFGLHIFNGLLESRCRLTPNPVNNTWPVNPNITDLCGYISCPADNYCINPSDFDFPENYTEMDIQALNYGFSNYDNILMAFLTNMSFFTFTGWSSINDIFGTAFNKIIVSLYSILLLLILGLVFMNLLMAALYDGFIKNKGIKAHIKEHHNIEEKEKNDPNKLSVGGKLSPIFHSMVSGVIDENRKSINNNNNEIDVDSSPMIKRILQRAGRDKSQHIEKNHEILLKKPNFKYPHFTIEYKVKPGSNIITTYAYLLLNSKSLNILILLCLTLNIVTIAMERVNMSETENFYMHTINFGCTIIFFIEIMMRLMILGPKKFGYNHFDKLDFVIIWLNMSDIIYLTTNGIDIFHSESSYSSIMKCIKTMRILRFLVGLQYWPRGSVLFIEMIKALVKTKEFIVLVVISIFVGALVGMEFFAYRIRFINDEEDIPTDFSLGSPPRLNYDGIGSALMTTTMICLNEEWNTIMYEHMRILGTKVGVYFITILLIGEVILIRMFMALFINGVIHSENIKNLLKIDNSWKKFFKSIFSVKNKEKVLSALYLLTKPKENPTIKINEIKLIPHSQNETNQINPIDTHDVVFEHIPKPVDLIKKLSLSSKGHPTSPYNMHHGHEKVTLPNWKTVGFIKWFKTVCKIIVRHRYFERAILGTILISVVFLMIHNPMESPDAFENSIQVYIDIVVIIFYFIEILLKILAYGVLFSGPDSFLLDPWNCFDVVLLVLTLLGTIDSISSFSSVNVKWCRVFRIFKIIKLAQGLRDAMNILFKSIPDLISLTFFYFMNLFVFGIIAVNYLKGVFFYCNTIDLEIQSCVITREDCFDYGGDWVNQDLNFDNIFISLSTLFQISTTEGWVEEMFNGIDFVGVQKNPIKDNHSIMALFYITFFIIANLIVINMFIGILVETYLHQKNLHSPFGHLNDEQKEWAYIKESMYKMKPKRVRQPPTNCIRNHCYKFVKGKIFRNVITGLNLLNIITFVLYYHRQPALMEDTLMELVLRFIAQGFRFFTKFWNLFDIFIIGTSWVGNVLLVFMGLDRYRWVKSLVNCIQVLRVARTIKSFKALNKLFYAVIQIIPQIANIAFLLLLFLISYSVIGVDFFAYLKPQQTAGNDNLNFHSFFEAFLNLIRSVTAEQWFLILNDCARTQGPDFTCREVNTYDEYQQYGLQGCGSSVAYIYFFSFHIIIALLVVNLFIAMIMNAYDEIMKVEHSAINVFQLKEILNLWREFDPEGLGFIVYRDFNRFFKKMAIQFGVQMEDFMDVKNRRDFLKLLNLPLYENATLKLFCYRFHDVIISLAQIAVLFNYGNMELEPEGGIPYFQKYEMKLLADRRFKITEFKSSEVMDFQLIMKAFKRLKMKRLGKGKSHFMLDIFDITKRLRDIKKDAAPNRTPTPKLIRNATRDKSRILKERSDSKKSSCIDLNNKVLGGMFFQHTISKEQSKEKENKEKKGKKCSNH